MSNQAAVVRTEGVDTPSWVDRECLPAIVCPECGEPCYGVQTVTEVFNADELLVYDCRICGPERYVWQSELLGKSNPIVNMKDIPF